MGVLATSDRLSSIINTVVEALPQNEQGNVKALAEIYFRHVSKQDATALDDSQLAGALLAHYQLLKQHVNSGPLIRVFNPEIDQDGFTSEYTVVQLVVRDRPFLIDTLFMSLDRQNLAMHRLWHSIIHVERDDAEQIVELQDVQSSNEHHLSLIHCEIERLPDEADQQKVREALQQKLRDLDIVVGDWGKMRDQLQEIKQSLNAQTIHSSPYDKEEIDAFLAWILDGNFTFLGYREYSLKQQNDKLSLYSVGNSGLGLLRDDGEDKESDSFNELPQALKQIITEPHVLVLSKSSKVAPVHRDVYMDFLGIQRFDEQGNVVGEYRFIGLLTSSAYHLTPEQIPLLRGKVKAVLARSKLPTDGYAHKRLRVILNQIPRDDLFQSSVDELYDAAMGILRLYDRQKLHLFTRVDAYQRFVSCLVYVPREKFNTKLRLKMSDILLKAFGGVSLEFNTHFSEANHVRMHFHVRTVPGEIKVFDNADVEAKLAAATRDWTDDFEQALISEFGERDGSKLSRRFAANLPLAYRERFSAAAGVEDVARLDVLCDDKPIDVCLYRRPHNADNELHLKIYGRGEPVALSKVLPMLEHFGVSVMAVYPYEFSDAQAQAYWLQRYDLLLENSEQIDLEVVRPQVEDGLRRIWVEEIESDKFNDLVLTTALDVDDVVILRALGKYMLQARVPFSLEYIQQALIDNRDIAQLLVKFFHARFDPALHENREHAMADNKQAIKDALQAVKSLDEDRIMRWYLILIDAMVRTNFYQRDDNGKRKAYVSFKFAAHKIPELPKPKPMFEIFVYSPRVEGVHLRGGKVARGGLRWSDRKEDFRTEVLGLVKAQMVKNSVIVPVGSKGGFVVKTATNSRDAFMQEGKACYRLFISGMLDITDNLIDGHIQAPEDTVRHDDDDPYLVVAADKGTASFSDLANSISAEYNFWLGDAFASGGSAGYDHKEMGITAKGAWESVKRHFRMLGKDIQARDDITVVGIGDMSGDVFGNGMLLSRHIKLLAAFNHLHIFIDPDPDTEQSYQERQRIFELPRSSWSDYDEGLISEGGGVFSRQDKTIRITPQMQSRFNIDAEELAPTELISALLKAPVDLLWNGGIGTYIKHSEESHGQVGDRANDALRVNGNEVQAQVIGEGGNLGLTQLGRIEYALNGGRLYTDAIDNSGGVNSSDHEVNIKILLNKVIEQGEMTEEQRNELLESMTDEVAELVLRQNYLQPQAIEVSAAHPEMLAEHARIIRRLEREDRLDRDIEFLPNDETIDERLGQGRGLTKPELAVMLAYSKMWLYEHLLASTLPDNQYFEKELAAYFPSKLRERFLQTMVNHRLHREIICTYLTNDMVNRMGIAFAFRAEEEMDENVANIACSYTIAREVFQANDYWADIEAMDNQVDAAVQIKLDMMVRQLLERAAFWFLRNVSAPIDVAAEIDRFAPTIQTLTGKEGYFRQHFADELNENAQPLIEAGLTEESALDFAALAHYDVSLDIVLIAEQTQRDANEVAKLYFALFDRLHGAWILEQIEQLPNDDYWDRRAQSAQLNSFYTTLCAIVLKLLDEDEPLGDEELDDWQAKHELLLARIDSIIGGLDKRDISLSTISVLLGEINSLNGHV